MESEQRKTALIVGAVVGIIFLGCAGLSLLVVAGISIDKRTKDLVDEPVAAADAGSGDEQPFDEPPAVADDEARDEFVELLRGALSDGGVDFAYDPDSFELRSDAGTLSMANLYDEYNATPVEDRERYLRSVVRSMNPAPLPDRWGDAKKHVLVSVRDRLFVELPAASGRGPHMAFKELAPQLVATLVFDTEDGMQFLSDEQLAKWSVSFDEAYAQALDNLGKRSSDRFEEVSPGVYRSPWHDNYDTARMLLAPKLQRLKLKGKPVVFVPNRDTLLVTGSEDDEALYAVVDNVDEALAEPRAMTGRAWVLSGKTWEPFLPKPSSKAWPDLLSLSQEADARDYNEQKTALDTRYERDDIDIFVATSLAAEDEKGARISYCVWTKGAESLLPKSDYVVLVDLDKPEKEQLVAAASWDAVQKATGALLKQEPALQPVRFHVKGFPNPRVVRALGIHPIFAKAAEGKDEADDASQ